MRLVLLGAPGSGKGTQAKRIAERTGFLHLSTGAILREAIASGGIAVKDLQAIMSVGELVPDDIVVDIVSAELSGNPPKNGYVLDGFPRTVDQAIRLDAALGHRGQALHMAIELRTNLDALLSRIVERATQSKESGGDVRADDNPETFRKRLRIYENQTAPVLDHYRTTGVLVSVDGMQDADAVENEIRALLGR